MHPRIDLFSLPNRTTLIFVLIMLLCLGVFLPAILAPFTVPFFTALFTLTGLFLITLRTLLSDYERALRQWHAQPLEQTHPYLAQRIREIIGSVAWSRRLRLRVTENPSALVHVTGTFRHFALVIWQKLADDFEQVYQQPEVSSAVPGLQVIDIDNLLRSALRELISFWQRYPLALLHTFRRTETSARRRWHPQPLLETHPRLAKKIQSQARNLVTNLTLWGTDDPVVGIYAFRNFRREVLIISRTIADEFEALLPPADAADAADEEPVVLNRAAVDAILYHELAHLLNRDVFLVMTSRALSRTLLFITIYFLVINSITAFILLLVPTALSNILQSSPLTITLTELYGLATGPTTLDGVGRYLGAITGLMLPLVIGAFFINWLLVSLLTGVREYYADHVALQHVGPYQLSRGLHYISQCATLQEGQARAVQRKRIFQSSRWLTPVHQNLLVPVHPSPLERWRALYAPIHVFTEPWTVGASVWGTVLLLYCLTLTFFTTLYTEFPHTLIPITLAFVLLATTLTPHLMLGTSALWQPIVTAARWYLGLLFLAGVIITGGVMLGIRINPAFATAALELWDFLDPELPPSPSGIAANHRITGNYAVTGASSDGVSYTGTMAIRQQQTYYTVRWDMVPHNQGIGIVQQNTLAIGTGRGCSTIAYRVLPDGTLEGLWSQRQPWQNRLGTEYAIPTVGTSASNITGTYTITGTNLDDSTYSGTLIIEQHASSYRLFWEAGDTFEGVGTLLDDVLAVGWSVDQPCGVVAYQIQADGMLTGKWISAEQSMHGTERASRR
jgi:hypothetical protein